MTKRSVAYPARMAGVLLLLVWLGPVTFAQTDAWGVLQWVGAPDRAAAESRVIPAGRALLLDVGTPLKLHLRDGVVVEGRFLGRTLLDSALYAPRFAAYARSTTYLPLVLGETLRVSLKDGHEWIAPFAGYGELTLLLRSHVGAPYLRVPFEFASEIRRANGERVEPGDLTRAFRQGLLPTAEALAMADPAAMGSETDRWSTALRVAVADIESATAELPSGGGTPTGTATDHGGAMVAGVILLTVVVSVVVFYVLLGSMFNDASRGCSSAASHFDTPVYSDVHLTKRPFDRYRGCFVGDPVAVAEWWPAPTDAGPPTALADVPTTNATMR